LLIGAEGEHLAHVAGAAGAGPGDAPVYDHRLERPDLLRLAHWDRLERDGVGIENEVVQGALASKVKALARAQKAGTISSAVSAEALLEFIVALSQTELGHKQGSRAAAAHRKRIAAAVAQLVAADA
jgi:hypothetical protein